MKRFFSMMLALLLLTGSARAEIVGQAGDDYIHQWIAPNGQALYFVSAEMEPFVHMEDVNFDGVEDVVAMTVAGASNYGAEFFVWDDGQYVPAIHFGVDALVNYTLHPEVGLVETYVQEGWAGVLHTRRLWRWEGYNLVQVAIAYSDVLSTMTEGDNLVTEVTDYSKVRLRVRDTSSSIDTLLMDVTVPVDDEQAVTAALEEERRVLWEDLLLWEPKTP